ncbi:MAG: transporter substrate-binding domain-containing protein [Pseudomonadales bacterium]|nr:transporter substrate-binding domain-containing protein [Pseudomonadales bacterium]
MSRGNGRINDVLAFVLGMFFVSVNVNVNAQPLQPLAPPLSQPLKVGIVHSPPLYVYEPGKIAKGSITEIMVRALERAGIEYEFAAYPLARLYRAIRSAEVDMMAGIKGPTLYHDQVIYSIQPFAEIELCVYAMPNRVLPETFAELQAKHLGLLQGATYAGRRAALTQESNRAHITNISSRKIALRMLTNGHIDYWLDFKRSMEHELGLRPVVNLRRNILDKYPVHFILNKDTKNSAELMQLLEHSLKALE